VVEKLECVSEPQGKLWWTQK